MSRLLLTASGAPRSAFLLTATASASLLVFAGCSGSSSGGAASVAAPSTTKISGTWTFEKVESTPNGLDYTKVTALPIRNALVQLITTADNKIVLSGTTDNAGKYSFDFTGTGAVKVRVLAQTKTPSEIQVEDNTASDAVWIADSPQLEPKGTPLTNQDFKSRLGWSGTAYTAERTSGAFNILDRCQLATEKVLAARPDLKIPALKVNWSPKNAPSTTIDVKNGDVGSSNFDGKELYIIGKEDVDTDEFDDHTVAHEWGHFFEAKLCRSDSLGGNHTRGNILEPSLAFGEGFGYGIAPIILGTTLNVDSSGKGQKDGSGSYDLEKFVPTEDPNPGWFSERSVQFIFYDLFDDNAEPFDTVNLGLKPILDVLVGAQKNTSARTTIFSFIHALKVQNPASAAAIDTLCANHKISPVKDEWGTDEQNNYDNKIPLLPVFRLATAGAPPFNVTMQGDDKTGSNRAQGVRSIRFVGNGQNMKVSVTTAQADHDVQISVFEKGIAYEGGGTNAVKAGTESITFGSDNGTTYVLLIIDYGGADVPYTATVSIQ